MVPATYKTGLFTEKGRIKTKKPKQVRPKKVFQEVKTLDLTITDKEINNIIDNNRFIVEFRISSIVKFL